MENCKKRQEAIASQDPRAYERAVEEEGLSGEEDPSLLERAMADRIMERQNIEEMDKERMYHRYSEFVDYSDKTIRQVKNVFEETEKKKQGLKNIMGYKGLKGHGKLSNCSDAAIGGAFRNTYETALEFLKRHDERLRR